jgi:hypothetical protein
MRRHEAANKRKANSKIGRPSRYSDALATEIYLLIADGHSLRAICEREDIPNRQTVLNWLRDNERFRDQYALARNLQAEKLFDEILEIADGAANETIRLLAWLDRQTTACAGSLANRSRCKRQCLPS